MADELGSDFEPGRVGNYQASAPQLYFMDEDSNVITTRWYSIDADGVLRISNDEWSYRQETLVLDGTNSMRFVPRPPGS